MALLAPLVYLVLRRRLECGRGAAVVGGLLVVLLPGVAMFGWLATDNGLEAVLGAVGLCLATSGRRWWWVAPVLAGLAVTTYPPGMAWAAAILAVCGWRALRSGWRDLIAVTAAAALAVLVVLFPRLWWTAGPEQILTGGGTFEGTLLANAQNLLRQLAVNGESYYFFAEQPALGSPILAVTALLTFSVTAALRWRAFWPWLLVAAITVVMWLPAGNLPGVRRTIALTVIAAIVLAVMLDLTARVAPRPAQIPVLAAAAALLLAPLAVTHAGWQHDHRTGQRVLTADFPIPAGPMPPTFAVFDRQLRAGQQTAESMVRDHDGARTLAVVRMLADRARGDTEGLPTPEEIVQASIPPEHKLAQ